MKDAMGHHKWKTRVKHLKREIRALSLAATDPRTPWYARMLAVLIVGYALSPIDLIPDFIPVLGYVDDLVLIPLGIILLLKLMPHEVMTDCRKQASMNPKRKEKHILAAAVIILIWLVSIIFTVRVCLSLFPSAGAKLLRFIP